MSNVDFYLLHDHQARRLVTLVSVAVGAAVGALAELTGFSFNISVSLCVTAVGIVEIVGAFMYVTPAVKEQRDVLQLPLRRSFIRAAFSAAGLLVLSFLRVPRMEAKAFERTLERVSVNPSNQKNIQEAGRVLEAARNVNAQMSPEVIASTGNKFAEVGKDNPEAWSIAQYCLDYRSFLNADLSPTTARSASFTVGLEVEILPGDASNHFQVFSSSEAVSVSDGARIEPLDARPFQRPGWNLSAKYIFVEGIGYRLFIDNTRFKNVVIKGANISYKGGQLILEDVYFVNCTFELPVTARSQRFVDAILKQTSVTFRE